MEIQSLKYILELEKSRNFTTAAAECALSQSSLTKHLKKVEAELGENIQLFDRTKRPVQITPAGQDFLRCANRIVDDYDLLIQVMQKYDPRQQSHIRIGAVPTMAQLGIMKLVHTFSKDLPAENNTELLDRPSMELVQMLSEGQLDAALIITTPEQPVQKDITYYQLYEYEIVFVAGKATDYAGRTSISLAEARGETFITTDKTTAMYSNCLAACATAGFEPKRIRTCRNFDMVMSLISEGVGVGLMGRKLAGAFTHFPVVAISLAQPVRGIVSLAIPKRSQLTPLTKKFISLALSWEFDV